MKKISILSLAVVTGMAFATPAIANMENPLYMPKTGTAFISAEMNYNNMEDLGDDQNNVAPAVSRTDDFEMGQWEDSFTLGYGFSDKLAVTISNADSAGGTTPNYLNTNQAAISVGSRVSSPVVTGIFRAVKKGNVVLDVVGSLNPSLQANEPMVFGAGIRAGVMTKKMTIAFGGHIGYGMSYDLVDLATGAGTDEVDTNMAYTLTGDFQYNINKKMSVSLGAEYSIISEQEATIGGVNEVLGEISGYDIELGLNIKTKKMLITPYIAMADYEQDDIDNNLGADMNATSGMSYGVRFGLEF